MTDPAATSAAERVRALHPGPHPRGRPNVWDPASAREYAGAGFGALATSSAAVALTLGYTDGHTPGTEMLAAAARIAAAVNVPVTADIEDGYGLPPAELAGRLLDAGLIGCNLEDSDPAGRALRDPAAQADYLAAVRQAAGPALVLNARVDVFIRPLGDGADAVGEAVRRARTYLAAGADCVYPIIAPPDSIARLVAEIDGPVNAMARPGGPTVADLAAAGVARSTIGRGLHTRVMAAVRELADGLAAEIGAWSGPAQR